MLIVQNKNTKTRRSDVFIVSFENVWKTFNTLISCL